MSHFILFFYCFLTVFSFSKIFSCYFSSISFFFQNFLILFLSAHFFFQNLKNRIFKKNTILIKIKIKHLNDVDKNINNWIYKTFKNSLTKLDKINFKISFYIII
jgi:hypothetical protein